MPKNLVFVIWMLCYPITIEIANYLQFLQGKRWTEGATVFGYVFDLFLYLFVAVRLYESQKNKLPKEIPGESEK